MNIQIVELHLRITIFLFPVSAQIFPGSYKVSSNVISQSGSNETGHCSDVTDFGKVCNSPRSSVLFDGIPTLTELDGDMWARQLLTFNTSIISPASIIFNFTNARDINTKSSYTGVELIEVVIFNCPSRNISISSIVISVDNHSAGTININQNSYNCSYLTRFCNKNISSTNTIITISVSSTYNRIYIAEIAFYSSPDRDCSTVGPILDSVLSATTNAVNVSTSSPVVVETASWSSFTVRETVLASSSVNLIKLDDQRLFIIIAVSVLAAIIVLILLMIFVVIIVYCNYKNKMCKKVPQHEQVITEVCNETGQIVKINNSRSNDFELKSKNFNQDGFYSTVIDRTHISDKSSEPIKSNHYETIEEALTLSESRCMTGVYAQIDKTKKKKSQLQPPLASPAIIIKWKTESVAMNNAQTKTSVDDLYSVVNKHMAPVIPMKSEDLLDELDKEIK